MPAAICLDGAEALCVHTWQAPEKKQLTDELALHRISSINGVHDTAQSAEACVVKFPSHQGQLASSLPHYAIQKMHAAEMAQPLSPPYWPLPAGGQCGS